MEENSILINNKNNYQEIIHNMEQSIDIMILFRSLYLIKKKFEMYKSNINKIYSYYNINKSKRIDAFGSYQININSLEDIIIQILKEINCFLLKLTSPKDLFLSHFLITNQKIEEMSLIIKELKNEIIEKELTTKYNRIFYDKKIKPLFQKKPKIDIIIDDEEDNDNQNIINDIDGGGEEITKEVPIVEYDRRGKIVKSFELLLNENDNNIKEYKDKMKEIEICYMENNNIKINESTNKNNNIKNNKNNNILFAETLPLIIVDYFQEHKNIAIVEIEEELSKELDLLFNKDLLIKINEYDEFINKYNNYKNSSLIVSKELKQYSLQLKQVQKNIQLYQRIIIDRKIKNEATIFLEDMLNKLLEKETLIQQKINEKKQNASIIDSKEKKTIENTIKNYNIFSVLDFSPVKNIEQNHNTIEQNIVSIQKIKKTKLFKEKINGNNTIKNYSPSSILITNQSNNLRFNSKNNSQLKSKRKSSLSSDFSDEQIEKALTNIFSFYSSLNNFDINNNDNNNDINDDINNSKYIDIKKYNRFCNDFKIGLTKTKINEIFNNSCKGTNNNSDNDNNNEDNVNIIKMNYEQFKNSLIVLSKELHTIKKQKLLKYISEKKNIISYMEVKECQRQEEEKNHNKLTEKLTGGIAKRALEKNQYNFISRHKKLSEEIIKNEYDYEKESKKGETEIINNFYKYIGIGADSKYKNKMKTNKINRFYKFIKNYK